jgi:hypothetical protein
MNDFILDTSGRLQAIVIADEPADDVAPHKRIAKSAIG